MAIDRTKINPADNTPVNDIELTEQEILNKTLDKDYNVLAVEVLGLGPDGKLKRLATDLYGNIGVASNSATNYAFYGSTSDATYDYVGKQSADGKWYIMRINKTTGVATYAAGDSDMATAWASPGTQTYAEYKDTF